MPYTENLRYEKKMQLKIVDIFLIFAQNIDCGYTLEPPRRCGSNEYPQSMFWSKNKKIRYTPANPFFHIEVYTFHGHVLRMNGIVEKNIYISKSNLKYVKTRMKSYLSRAHDTPYVPLVSVY